MSTADRSPSVPLKKRILLGSLPLIFSAAKLAIRWVGRAPRPRALRWAKVFSLPVAAISRKASRRNQRVFFEPQGWSSERLSQLDLAYQEYMVRLRTECAACLEAPRERVLAEIQFDGEDLLRDALRGGRGAMVIGTHYGTWWHAPVGLAGRGYPVGAVFNSFPLNGIEGYLVQKARRVGIELNVVDRGAREAIVRASRSNGVFYLTIDVATRERERDWIDFGPALVNVNPGPAILAVRERMPVFYALCEQQSPRGSRIRIVPAAAGPSLRPSQMREEWASLLLKEVRRRPEQWWAWGFVELKSKPVAIPNHKGVMAHVPVGIRLQGESDDFKHLQAPVPGGRVSGGPGPRYRGRLCGNGNAVEL